MKAILRTKKEYLESCKRIAQSDPHWLLLSHNTPNGYETSWSVKIKSAVLKRVGMIPKTATVTIIDCGDGYFKREIIS